MKALVFDIEGTTTDINFVHDVLFPFARKRIESFVRANEKELSEIIDSINRENNLSSLDETISLLVKWIDEDKKVKELKEIQGLIWKEGYDKEDYTAHVYSDVIPALKKWKENGLDLFIYSSGSIKAQKLLFSHTEAGDITNFFKGYFDTTIGSKKEPSSYERIAKEIGCNPQEITFFTDNVDEVKAAKSASFNVIHVNRDGLYNDSEFNMAKNFSEVRI